MTTEGMPTVVADPLPKGLAVFRQFLAWVGRTELTLAIVALVVVVALSSAQAFLRYFVGASLWWAQEVAENTIMISYFLGISYVFKTRQEIYVEFVSSMTPMKVQLALYILEQILTLIFAVAILWLVYLFSPTLFNMRTPVLRLPAIVTPAPLILSSAMIALTSIYYMAFGVWSFRRGTEGRLLTDIEQKGLILSPWVEEH